MALRALTRLSRASHTMASIQAKPFKLALVQLGGLGDDKAANLQRASQGVKEAVQTGKADLVVLPVSSRRLLAKQSSS